MDVLGQLGIFTWNLGVVFRRVSLVWSSSSAWDFLLSGARIAVDWLLLYQLHLTGLQTHIGRSFFLLERYWGIAICKWSSLKPSILSLLVIDQRWTNDPFHRCLSVPWDAFGNLHGVGVAENVRQALFHLSNAATPLLVFYIVGARHRLLIALFNNKGFGKLILGWDNHLNRDWLSWLHQRLRLTWCWNHFLLTLTKRWSCVDAGWLRVHHETGRL